MDTEDDIKKRHAGYALGQDLSSLSVEELGELIGLLSSEIDRINEAKSAKSEHLSAAEALFNAKS